MMRCGHPSVPGDDMVWLIRFTVMRFAESEDVIMHSPVIDAEGANDLMKPINILPGRILKSLF
jgi:hypothetical protein